MPTKADVDRSAMALSKAVPLHLTFLLPALSGRPVGGYAVVYEHANRLARRGHVVTVEHVVWWTGRPDVKMVARHFLRRIRRKRARVAWFELDDRIRVTDRLTWQWRKISSDEIVAATAWQTAERLGRVKKLRGRGCYLIQGYETWSGPEDRVDGTFRLPLRRAAIATWLTALVEQKAGERVQLVPNAIDTSIYKLTTPPEQRSAHEVSMLWHELPAKGSRHGLEALKLAKKAVPELHATLFSAHARPPDLPEWITFIENASRLAVAEILNESAIFISPSLCEGWPLPPAEALACGAALLSSDIPGIRDYATNGETAILVPPGDAAAMATALADLLSDRETRMAIAKRGHDFVRGNFNWNHSTGILETMFLEVACGL